MGHKPRKPQEADRAIDALTERDPAWTKRLDDDPTVREWLADNRPFMRRIERDQKQERAQAFQRTEIDIEKLDGKETEPRARERVKKPRGRKSRSKSGRKAYIEHPGFERHGAGLAAVTLTPITVLSEDALTPATVLLADALDPMAWKHGEHDMITARLVDGAIYFYRVACKHFPLRTRLEEVIASWQCQGCPTECEMRTLDGRLVRVPAQCLCPPPEALLALCKAFQPFGREVRRIQTVQQERGVSKKGTDDYPRSAIRRVALFLGEHWLKGWLGHSGSMTLRVDICDPTYLGILYRTESGGAQNAAHALVGDLIGRSSSHVRKVCRAVKVSLDLYSMKK
jgi:hypothetical protein